MKNELASRLFVGFIVAGMYVGILVFLPPVVFALAILVVVGIANHEFSAALKTKGISINVTLLYLNSLLVLAGLVFYNWKGLLLVAIALSLLYLTVFFFFNLLAKRQNQHDGRFYVLQLFWLLIPFFSLIHLRFFQRGVELILLISLIITFNDIFAYFGGKNFGKHPLAPKLSPKKTIEGSLFGFIGIVWGALAVYLDIFSVKETIFIGMVVVALAQIGDLLESKFKRFAGIKDSGQILPGHGGIMDRADAFLLPIPIFYFFLIYFYPQWVQNLI